VEPLDLRVRDDQLGFIKMNHQALSECSTEGFERYGRGVVLVDVEQHDQDMAIVPYDFLPTIDLAKIMTDLEASKEGELLRDYDPEVELVIVFAWWEGKKRINFDSYRIGRAQR